MNFRWNPSIRPPEKMDEPAEQPRAQHCAHCDASRRMRSLSEIAVIRFDTGQVSVPPVSALLGHMIDAFLVGAVALVTDSERKKSTNPQKIYQADPGLIRVFDASGPTNVGPRWRPPFSTRSSGGAPT